MKLSTHNGNGPARHQGVAAADLPVEGRLPSFDGANGWLNSPPLTPSALRGKVVVVQFWTYTCINWLRAKIHNTFAADLPADLAAIVGATQRPVAELAFSEANGRPAWKTLPSWAVVATSDKAAGTDIVRSMARRAGATITELVGSHVIMVSQPPAVTDVILMAVAQTTPGGAVASHP